MHPLIDTNVVSELMRRAPDPRVQRWAEKQKGFHLSVITIEEIEFGLAWKPSPAKTAWLETFTQRHCQVLSITHEIARHAGRLRGRLAAEGISRTQADLLIAATAHLHILPLITRDTADFAGCGIDLINPFRS
ncbi:MAG: type II toxin-antitoxin system VapC family toxin [Verrucomicrobia bacterium]|nr:type II toxin-antitoxin system VapC family toxin [Verrucomicrobiota bacterium]